MSHVYFAVAQCYLYACWEFEQAEVVGYCGSVFAYSQAELVLCEVVLFDEVLVGECYFECGEVLSLYVFDECHLHHVFVVDGADVCGDGCESYSLACSPSALACDDDVCSVAHVSQCDGLYDAYLSDAIGEFLQAVVVELSSWLVGIGVYAVHAHFLEVG